jgi:hypothetical protein
MSYLPYVSHRKFDNYVTEHVRGIGDGLTGTPQQCAMSDGTCAHPEVRLVMATGRPMYLCQGCLDWYLDTVDEVAPSEEPQELIWLKGRQT